MECARMGASSTKEAEKKPYTGSTRAIQYVGPRNRYILGERLGQGTFGFVMKAFDQVWNIDVAIKFMKRGNNLDPVYAEREILNHRSLVHPHVVIFHQVFLTKSHLCIAMELAGGGSLGNLMKMEKCLQEQRARWFFQQLVVAMDYCHNMGVVMRDIKLNNLLLDKDQKLIKICDFGFSKHVVKNTKPNTQLGTPSYIAPEILRSKVYDGQKADIWTCGIALFHMLYGCPPVDMHRRIGRESTKEKLLRVENEPIEIPAHQVVQEEQFEVSEECRDLLSKLLVKDPSERITLSELKKHKWITENLPAGTYEYNETLQSQQSGSESYTQNWQSEEEIKKIIGLATSFR